MKLGGLLQAAGFLGAFARHRVPGRFFGLQRNWPDGFDNILGRAHQRCAVADQQITARTRASKGCPGTASTSRP